MVNSANYLQKRSLYVLVKIESKNSILIRLYRLKVRNQTSTFDRSKVRGNIYVNLIKYILWVTNKWMHSCAIQWIGEWENLYKTHWSSMPFQACSNAILNYVDKSGDRIEHRAGSIYASCSCEVVLANESFIVGINRSASQWVHLLLPD